MNNASRGRCGARVSLKLSEVLLAACIMFLMLGAAASAGHAAQPNLVTNPSFETATTGWAAYAGSTISRVAGGVHGDWALEMRGPSSTAQFGVNDSPNWVTSVVGVGSRYRFTAQVRSDTSHGVARLNVREFAGGGGPQVGVTTKSAPVTLTSSWQTITVDYVVTTAGSTLDFQVLDVPVVPNEVFQVDDVSIRLVLPDQAPVITAPAVVAGVEGELLNVEITVVDPDDDPIVSLSADLSGLPAGASFTPDSGNTSGVLNWTPGFDQSGGPYVVSFIAANALSDSAGTSITIANLDRAPVVTSIETITSGEGTPIQIQVTAVDPDGEAITSLVADLDDLPPGHTGTFTPNAGNDGGTFAWTPTFVDGGHEYFVQFTASNALSATSSTWLVVDEVDRAPVVTALASTSVVETEMLSLWITAVDPDGEAIASLTADLSGLPAGASFVPDAGNGAGTLTWTPDHDQAPGPYSVSFTATNALTGSATTSIAVTNLDRAPLVSAPTLANASEGAAVTIEVQASDPDGDAIAALTADLAGLPAGHDAVFEADPGNVSGRLVWTPGWSDSGGPYSVSFTATNALGGSATTEVLVLNVDRAPVMGAPGSIAATDSHTVTISVTAADLDGDPIESLTADLSALPVGHDAVFTPDAGLQSGTLTWTPLLGGSGTFAVSFVASNAGSDTATTTISVARVDHAPVVSAPAVAGVTEGQELSLTVTATDPDADAIDSLTADLSALPAGAIFTPAADHLSGTLVWTPGFTAAPGPYSVTFTAANALNGADTTVIHVVNVDHAPVVTAPDSATGPAGSMLTVQVTAGDSDLESLASLTADLSSLPAGHDAVFTVAADHASGTLTWTPRDTDTGDYLVSFTVANAMNGSASTALHVRGLNLPPVAALSVSPLVTSAPMLVTADASASFDPGGPMTYRFDFGNGTVIGPQASPVASATYIGPGVHRVLVTVSDALGVTDTATAIVQTHLGNLCTNPGVENTSVGWTAYGGAAIVRVSGQGRTGNYAFQATTAGIAAQGFNDSPDWVPATAGVGRKYRVMAWARSLTHTGKAFLRVQESQGAVLKGTVVSPEVTLSPTWKLLSADYAVKFAGTRLDLKILYTPTVAGEKFMIDDVQVLLLPVGDQPPVLMAAAAVNAIAGQPLSMTVNAADPDGQSLASLSASFATLPPGHNAGFVSDPGSGVGTFTWTPAPGDISPTPYLVTLGAANGQVASAPLEIRVANASLSNLCANPGFETNASGWSPYGAGATITRLNAGRSGSFAIQLACSTGTGWGVNDQLDIVTTHAGVGRTYRYSAWVRSATSNGKVKMRLQEFLAGVQKGATVESPEVTLTSTWQRIAASYTTTTAGTRIDMKIVDAPVAAVEAFLIDDVEVVLMPVGDRPPVLVAPATATVAASQPMTVSVTVSDPDADPITSLVADLSGLPAGHTATFAPGPGNTSGILSWTPGAADARALPYTVAFTAANSKTALGSTAITVSASEPANLVGNPGFETGLSGWGTYGAVGLARVAGGHSGAFGLLMTSSGASSFGCDDTPNWITTVAGAGAQYRFKAWVRSVSSTSPVRLRIYEFLGGVQQGPVIMSQEIPVSTTWQLLTVDHTALVAGSTLSMRVTMSPSSANQSFVADDVSIQLVSGGGALLAADLSDDGAPAAGAAVPRALIEQGASLALEGDAAWTARLEGIDALLENALPIVTLRHGASENTALGFVAFGEDQDGNGREEQVVAFERAQLRELFAGAAGGVVEAAIVVKRGSEATVEIPVRLELTGAELVFTSSFAPNPMQGEGTLSFALTRPGPVRVELFDPSGRRVRMLMDEGTAKAGRYRLAINTSRGGVALTPGVYFYRVLAGEGIRSGRMVVVR